MDLNNIGAGKKLITEILESKRPKPNKPPADSSPENSDKDAQTD
jgi:hypothetical protein